MAYYGYPSFVECAEKRKRYGECASLRICALEGTTGQDYVEANFPTDFIVVVMQLDKMVLSDMLDSVDVNCNVVIRDRLLLPRNGSTLGYSHYVVGNETMTKDPLCTATRGNDREFSDIIEWVVQALIYGEEQGLTIDMSRCVKKAPMHGNVSDLIFMNAVYCVGNHGDLLAPDAKSGMNLINNGSTGLLYAPPWGNLDLDPDSVSTTIDHTQLDIIKSRGYLRCGVVTPVGYDGGNISDDSHMLVGMSADYCRALAAAIFTGDSGVGVVNFATFSESDDSSFNALAASEIDVLSGAKVELMYDFANDLRAGFQFSKPFYYGNETTAFYSFASRDDDTLLSSFVNAIVLATIYALEHGITREHSEEMPLSSIFGNNYDWALRDTVFYSGNWKDMYEKNFVNSPNYQLLESAKGRNALNTGGPQIHSFPGLVP